MRGLEGVWRGASRHQSLIIYRPYFPAQKNRKTRKTRWKMRESSVEIILLPQKNHTSMDVVRKKEGCGEGTTPDKSGKGERWV